MNKIVYGICIVVIVILVVLYIASPWTNGSAAQTVTASTILDPAGQLTPCPFGQTKAGALCEDLCPPGYHFDGNACVGDKIGSVYNPNTRVFFNLCPAGSTYRYDSTLQREFCDSPCTSDKVLDPATGQCNPRCDTSTRYWNPNLQKCVCDRTKGLVEDSTGACVSVADRCPVGYCKRRVVNGVEICDVVKYSPPAGYQTSGATVDAIQCVLPGDEYVVPAAPNPPVALLSADYTPYGPPFYKDGQYVRYDKGPNYEGLPGFVVGNVYYYRIG